MAIGDYPVEYNPSIHGPYDPARYYGKSTLIISGIICKKALCNS